MRRIIVRTGATVPTAFYRWLPAIPVLRILVPVAYLQFIHGFDYKVGLKATGKGEADNLVTDVITALSLHCAQLVAQQRQEDILVILVGLLVEDRAIDALRDVLHVESLLHFALSPFVETQFVRDEMAGITLFIHVFLTNEILHYLRLINGVHLPLAHFFEHVMLTVLGTRTEGGELV